MRLEHLYEIGSSIVANMPGSWWGRESLEWVFDLQRERIAWARDTLVTGEEPERSTFIDATKSWRLSAPRLIRED